GINNVVTTDVGGTSFDVSVIAEGRHIYAREKPIMRYRVNIPMIDVTSIGAGGGTIGWVDSAGGLKMGPVSAGSLPGPACYIKGGTEPTATDADLMLGTFNPDFFLGGRVKLDKDAATQALKKVGDKIGMDPIEVAAAMVEIQGEHMADLLRLVVTRTGYDPRDFSVFCFGGGGPTHGAMYAQQLGFQSVYMFPQSSVWSAFGLSSADVSRIFDKSVFYRMPIEADELTSLFDDLENAALDEMQRLKFKAEDVVLTREVSMKFGRQVNVERIPVARKKYETEDVQKITDDFIEFYRSVYGEGAGFVEAGLEMMSLHVNATIPAVRPAIAKMTMGPSDSSGTIKFKRDAYWHSQGKFVSTNIYDGDQLKPGHVIEGPGIIELETTTIMVPYDSELQIDEYGFFKVVYR
ncbi:MAG: hydantoinase/oxoprolinase family protein, partial [Chloroflexi bacterium]|nr:hydantoinase/oxoprolinase family protein [Chloroflexota bacterium]